MSRLELPCVERLVVYCLASRLANPAPMRPSILFPLFAPVTRLPGIGPKIGELVARAAGEKIVDLLWHLPAGLIDRRHAPAVGAADARPTLSDLGKEPRYGRSRGYGIPAIWRATVPSFPTA